MLHFVVQPHPTRKESNANIYSCFCNFPKPLLFGSSTQDSDHTHSLNCFASTKQAASVVHSNPQRPTPTGRRASRQTPVDAAACHHNAGDDRRSLPLPPPGCGAAGQLGQQLLLHLHGGRLRQPGGHGGGQAAEAGAGGRRTSLPGWRSKENLPHWWGKIGGKSTQDQQQPTCQRGHGRGKRSSGRPGAVQEYPKPDACCWWFVLLWGASLPLTGQPLGTAWVG